MSSWRHISPGSSRSLYECISSRLPHLVLRPSPNRPPWPVTSVSLTTQLSLWDRGLKNKRRQSPKLLTKQNSCAAWPFPKFSSETQEYWLVGQPTCMDSSTLHQKTHTHTGVWGWNRVRSLLWGKEHWPASSQSTAWQDQKCQIIDWKRNNYKTPGWHYEVPKSFETCRSSTASNVKTLLATWPLHPAPQPSRWGFLDTFPPTFVAMLDGRRVPSEFSLLLLRRDGPMVLRCSQECHGDTSKVVVFKLFPVILFYDIKGSPTPGCWVFCLDTEVMSFWISTCSSPNS